VDWRDYADRREAASEDLLQFWFPINTTASRLFHHPTLSLLPLVYLAVGPGVTTNPLVEFTALWGEGKVFTKWSIAPDIRKLPYTIQSAIDFEVGGGNRRNYLVVVDGDGGA